MYLNRTNSLSSDYSPTDLALHAAAVAQLTFPSALLHPESLWHLSPLMLGLQNLPWPQQHQTSPNLTSLLSQYVSSNFLADPKLGDERTNSREVKFDSAAKVSEISVSASEKSGPTGMPEQLLPLYYNERIRNRSHSSESSRSSSPCRDGGTPKS